MATTGLVTTPSEYGPTETMARLESAIKAAGMSVFAKIDHSTAAADVGMSLRSTEVVIFGNAKGGTLLMQEHQAAGIDLPLKALVYQDESGRVFLAYNDPHWIAERHGLGSEVAAAVEGMVKSVNGIVVEATETCFKD
jgi:uncharacterized protein (DUF302 family)